MSDLLNRLGRKEQRGSKPRCHWLTHGGSDRVAAQLSALADPWATVSPADCWMPEGFEAPEEPQLHRALRLLDADICRQLGEWWLPPDRQHATTPNFDIASTCMIDGAPGLLLVEAKAHDEELKKEAVGRILLEDASEDRRASHGTIGDAIEAARRGLSNATSSQWQISRDSHYQISNRFAWAWKLTELGLPVVVIYLGFLNALEMDDRGKPFGTHAEWESLVRDHSKSLFPDEVWGRRSPLNGVPLIPLIRSTAVALDGSVGRDPDR
jgi:hypothetical protein